MRSPIAWMAENPAAWIATVLVAVAIGGLVGYAISESEGGDRVAVVTETATPEGPTQAEIEAERQREEDRLCLEAQQAQLAAEAGCETARQAKINELLGRGWDYARANAVAGLLAACRTPPEVRQAIDRYCD